MAEICQHCGGAPGVDETPHEAWCPNFWLTIEPDSKTLYVGKFVNVYLIDRAYGGPEEGGWWYDTGQFIRGVQGSDDEVERIKNTLQTWCDEENKERRSDIGSVLSEGKYVVQVEDEPGKDYPERRPHYE